MKKTIKIIDLLNMIANGEEVPIRIKYENNIYIHIDNYCYYCDETNLILSDRIFAEYSKLNDEVEILDEEEFENIEECFAGVELEYNKNSIEYKINQLIRNQQKIIEKLNKNNSIQ